MNEYQRLTAAELARELLADRLDQDIGEVEYTSV